MKKSNLGGARPGAGRPQTRLDLRAGELVDLTIMDGWGGARRYVGFRVLRVSGKNHDEKVLVIEPAQLPEQEPTQ